MIQIKDKCFNTNNRCSLLRHRRASDKTVSEAGPSIKDVRAKEEEGSAEHGQIWTGERVGSDAHGRPEGYFGCFAFFTSFFEIFGTNFGNWTSKGGGVNQT